MAADVKKTIVGIVSSDKMDKSRTVLVEAVKKHPTYGKYVGSRTKFMAHDAENKSKIGDKVVLIETRPLSKNKRWQIQEILGKAE